MQVKIERGRIILNTIEVLSALSLEDKKSLIETLSCDDEIIANVTAQLLDGWTEQGSHGATRSGAVEPFCPLDKARREIALRSGEVAKKEIEALCSSLRWTKANEEKYSAWGFKMYYGGPRIMPPQITYDYDELLQYEVIRKNNG